MVFLQSSAPTGWTQNTASSLANATLRVITSGNAGTGGADAFATTFSGSKATSGSGNADVSPLGVSVGSAGATTISTPQLPSHNHQAINGDPRGYKLVPNEGDPAIELSVPGMDLKHANVIVCSKD